MQIDLIVPKRDIALQFTETLVFGGISIEGSEATNAVYSEGRSPVGPKDPLLS